MFGYLLPVAILSIRGNVAHVRLSGPTQDLYYVVQSVRFNNGLAFITHQSTKQTVPIWSSAVRRFGLFRASVEILVMPNACDMETLSTAGSIGYTVPS